MTPRHARRDPLDLQCTTAQASWPEGRDEQLDWLAREALLAALERESRQRGDWPGWGRTTVSGSKVQRPAIRRRASSDSSNLFGGPGRIKPPSMPKREGTAEGPPRTSAAPECTEKRSCRTTHRPDLPRKEPQDDSTGRGEGQGRSCSGEGGVHRGGEVEA